MGERRCFSLHAGLRAGVVPLVLLLVVLLEASTRNCVSAAASCSADSSSSSSSEVQAKQQEPAGVGSQVVFEDATIKMWELSLGPGESSGVHTHWLPYTFYVLNSSTLEVTAEDGQHLLTFTGSVGDAFSFDLEGDYLVDAQRGNRIHRTHNARNVGSTLFREILVEKKVAVLSAPLSA